MSAEPPIARDRRRRRGERGPERRGHPRGGGQLDGVALAVAKAERMAAPPFGAHHRERRRRVEAARQKHDCAVCFVHGGQISREWEITREDETAACTEHFEMRPSTITTIAVARRHSVAPDAAEHGGPVLDLACGTGRLMVPLLRDGHTVVGSTARRRCWPARPRRSRACRGPNAPSVAASARDHAFRFSRAVRLLRWPHSTAWNTWRAIAIRRRSLAVSARRARSRAAGWRSTSSRRRAAFGARRGRRWDRTPFRDSDGTTPDRQHQSSSRFRAARAADRLCTHPPVDEQGRAHRAGARATPVPSAARARRGPRPRRTRAVALDRAGADFTGTPLRRDSDTEQHIYLARAK